ncbi:hemin ABC transporter substrate-binding protein [Dactylosporangium sucinum]|uniref:ABC transporter substrate-binding protein n=1 Tax=Dactylosporangium sucinum TaxID=1424081 RepID=A0A917U1U8_9ACTN|nr:ABC transporter substrate-binding protein [Dactylosporangium sucinum]GGM46801.1 ABC transporter substrate-binding protein [Dactylosporangium sucinum]
MNRLTLATAALLALSTLAGCAGQTTTLGDPQAAGTGGCGPVTATLDTADVTPLADRPQPALPVTVDSADGQRVTVTDVSRILPVNLYGSIAEIVFSLGLGDRVVGRDTSTTFPAAAHLPLVTPSGHDLSAEGILRLDPTVVVTDRSIGPAEVIAQLRRSGIPVVFVDDQQTLSGVSAHIRQVAAALGVPGAGEQLVRRVEADVAAARVAPAGRPLRVAFLYVRGAAGVYLMGGKGAGSDAMIEAIGAQDAGTAIGLSGFRPLTSEGLINAAPDVILVMTEGLQSVGGVDGLLRMPGVAQTPAGERRRIVDMADGVLLSFGPRVGEAVRALARAVTATCR